jgi:hypothetical protein
VLQVGYVEDEVFGGSRPSISGLITDVDGNKVLVLNDNLITFVSSGKNSDETDVRLVGKLLTVSSRGTVVLEMAFDLPHLRIDRLRMRYRDIICELDQTFGVTMPSQTGRQTWLFDGIETKGAKAAISYRSNAQEWNAPGQLARIVGRGIVVPASGATLAVGAGSMLIKRVQAFGGA